MFSHRRTCEKALRIVWTGAEPRGESIYIYIYVLYIYMYIRIGISIYRSISLSLSIYIYIYTHYYNCTPEVNTSEIIVDLQWHVPMDCHWHFPTEVHVWDFWCLVLCPEGRGRLCRSGPTPPRRRQETPDAAWAPWI